MKLTLKIAKYLLIFIIILLIILVALLSFALKTETGSRYLLGMVPGLSVVNAQGSLSGGWRAESLIWQNQSIKITVNDPQLDWYANCLFRANVCIDNLTVTAVNIDTQETTDEQTDDTPIQLPTINLPVSVQINNAQVVQLNLNNQTIVSDLQLTNTHWQNADVSFQSLTLYSNQAKAKVTLQGNIQLANNWPLTITGQAQLDEMLQTPWLVKLSAGGELQQQLAVDITSTGYLQANLKGSAQVLAKDLPAKLALTVEDFLPSNIEGLPSSLLVKQLTLTANGDLAQGYKLASNGTLAGQTEPVELTLQGVVTGQNLDLQTLRLATAEQQYVTINGQVDWQQQLTAQAKIDYQQFAWLQLYPLASAPPVDLQKLQATLNYQNDNYQANLTGSLTGPAGNFSLLSELTGDLQQLTVSKLQIDTAEQGNLTGNAKVTYDPNLTWLVDLKLNAINPNYWVASFSGLLNGNIHSEGSIVNNEIITDNQIDIRGTLNNQPTQLKSQLLARQRHIQIPELLVVMGSNRITGQATIDENIQANIDINLPALNQVLPELTGSLTGNAQVTGSLQAPQGTIQLTGQSLAYQQQRIEQLQLVANINAQQQATLKLQANRITSGTTQFGNLIVEGNGNATNQQLTMQLAGGIAKLDSAITSQQDAQKNWNINISKLQIAYQGQDWRLQNATNLRYTTAGVLTLDSHCFINGQASLCGVEQQRLLPTTQINYRLANFSLASLQPWYPENFNWQGILSANITLQLPQQGPIGNIEINANNGRFQLRQNTDDNWHDLPYQTLHLVANLTPSRIDTNLQFAGNNLGNLRSQITINPLAANKPINGDFSISGFDIGILQPFIPDIDELEGNINGQGNISGGLEKPYISGRVALTNGTVKGEIPVSLEQLQVTAQIEGESVRLNGSWRSGTQGNATLNGNASWNNGLNLNATVKASNLPVVVAPYANVEADADLQLQMNTETLNVGGTVQIPRGLIKIRELPPSTVKLSPDAVIVTNQPTESKAPVQLNMNVDVVIGRERLLFQGFGLTADVAGNLKISRDMFTQGSLNLNNGIYRAYGQRLEIRRARILFTGSLTEPTLDVEAVREVGDVTAGIRVRGPTTQPIATVFSDPAMNQDQALSYIIFGRPMSAGDDNVLAQAAIAMGVAGGSGVVAEAASKFGIQDFQLDTAGSGDDTSVVASGNITNDLSIHYGVNVFKAMNTLMFRYKLTKTVYLEAASGTASSLDLFYKKSFR